MFKIHCEIGPLVFRDGHVFDLKYKAVTTATRIILLVTHVTSLHFIIIVKCNDVTCVTDSIIWFAVLLQNEEYCFFKFCVKPSERTKTDHGLPTYDGFVVMRRNADIYSAYCQCKGGIDGLCKHVAAALFDLQATVCYNIFTTCTSEKCTWTRRQNSDKYAVRLHDLHLIKAEFGKDEKMCLKPWKVFD